jgi:DNA-binding transcriptional LysR family regulator
LFEASARLLSFKNAAEELLLTPSAVSHGIQSLEEWLGVPLFLRTTRGLVLSEAGADYLPIVAGALDTIAAGSARISSRCGRGVLAISVAPTFATRWLLPRLVAILGRPYLTPTGYWLVSSEEAASEPRIAAFREWIREQLLISQTRLIPEPGARSKVRSAIGHEQSPRVS